MAGVLAWFWNERFWLPHNVTWADLKSTEEASFPQAEDLLLAAPLAFCLFLLRMLFERFIARPCAVGLRIQSSGPQRATPNAILEKVFTAITKHPDEKRLEGLSKQLDWDVRSIQRWFRQRRNQEKPSTLTRFCESMWRFTFYLYIFTYGLRFLKKTPWLWNTKECWVNYPNQPLTADLQYYYIVELSFYLSLLLSQFTDMRRKDFLLMLLHHLATISLISFSYVNNMVRVGTLLMCLHDAVDVLMEAAKMANYARCQTLCNFLFAMFSMFFISSRLGVLPIWILNTTLFESWEMVGPYPSWWLFNLLLLLLQALHSYWSYLIVKTACRAVCRGRAGKWNPLNVSKDDRSDMETSSDEEDGPMANQKPHSSATNGTNNKTHEANGYGPCPEEHH
ncbi:ceramide synthase 6 isoform X1 [Gadus morhua]|uniref:Ceramide synthase 6 n=1 Tax=Gadus morhua TaxID=8049 RepID=A0A8C5CN63_GADMO|nr:ceramide synthase 6 isoform X1 [Gadus morhua]